MFPLFLCPLIDIGFSMYNIAFTGIVIVAIVNLVELDQVSEIMLQAVGVLWGTFFCCFAFVLPRLLDIARDRLAKSSSSSRLMSQPLNHQSDSIQPFCFACQTRNMAARNELSSRDKDASDKVPQLRPSDHNELPPFIEETESIPCGRDTPDTELYSNAKQTRDTELHPIMEQKSSAELSQQSEEATGNEQRTCSEDAIRILSSLGSGEIPPIYGEQGPGKEEETVIEFFTQSDENVSKMLSLSSEEAKDDVLFPSVKSVADEKVP
jgi:hypothetical protein